ncbi:hypothetical protein CLOP_g12148 [Closterium sp. NIES-67]|nr:hypothetical protein CLOP_g12148 [Closterium sp. NIES-67]
MGAAVRVTTLGVTKVRGGTRASDDMVRRGSTRSEGTDIRGYVWRGFTPKGDQQSGRLNLMRKGVWYFGMVVTIISAKFLL